VPSSALSPLRRVPAAEARPDIGELARLIAAGARVEGCTDAFFPGVRYARYSSASNFNKGHAPGPVLTLIAQGRKVVRCGAGELNFDPSHYLVITADGSFEGFLLESALIFFVTTVAERPQAPTEDSHYNRRHFNSREFRFFSHKRIPPRNAFSF